MKKVNREQISKEMFSLYKFVIHLYDIEYELFKVLQKFCMGYIVANALNFDNISSNKVIFKDKKVFFDTNFVLRLLGLEGEFYQNSYNGIINVLKENNCKLYIFSHTYDEIKNILETAKSNLNNTYELSPEVQKYFWNNNKTEDDIVLLISTLEKRLNLLGINVSRIAYENTKKIHQIDEQALYKCIVSIYSRRENFNEDAKKDVIWNDVKSMSLIYRDINMIRSYSVQTLQDVFITTNQALAFACKTFDKTLGKKENAIAPCMTDAFLGTLLWAQNPVRYDEYNAKQILASCYSSVKPDNKALSRFSAELEKLKKEQKITNDDYMLVKQYNIVEDLLSDKIMGDSDSVDEKTLYEVIQDVKTTITKNFEIKLQKEQEDNLKSKSEKRIAEKKYADLVDNLRNEVKKKAKIRSAIEAILSIIIYLSIIIGELYFNIIEAFNESLQVLIIARSILYISVAIQSLIEVKSIPNTYRSRVLKLYKRECQKLNIAETAKINRNILVTT